MKPASAWFAAVLILSVLMTAVGAANAQVYNTQVYPARPVKLVVPYAAGGPNDIMARILAQKLSEALGGQFYVENAAGAGGTWSWRPGTTWASAPGPSGPRLPCSRP